VKGKRQALPGQRTLCEVADKECGVTRHPGVLIGGERHKIG